MSTVFVSGATGYIGNEVATAFRRAGYKVYGLTRSEEKAARLLKDEILPVIGDSNNPETYQDIVAKANIIVDCTMDYSAGVAANKKLLETVVAASKQQPKYIPKKTYIYTSGVLVYGHHDEVRDETSELLNTNLSWRIDFEVDIISQPDIKGIVLRPGFVYGKSGSVSAGLFSFLASGTDTIVIHGNKDKRFNWIHLADLSNSFVLAAEKSPAGEIFNIVSTFTPTWEELNLAAAKIAGFEGKVEYDETGDDWLTQNADMNIVVTNTKAFNLLGWRPKQLGFIENLEIYFESIKAYQS